MTYLLARLWLCMVLVTAFVVAQAKDQRKATVGMRAYIEQVVLEGSELVPAPADTSTQVVVRVVKTWPHIILQNSDHTL